MIDERKKFIDDALRNAKEANEKLQGIEQQGRDLLEKARDEQARILREASDMRKQIIDEARGKAAEESAAMIAEARRVIQQEKEEALLDIRSQVAGLSIAVAEKLLRKELEGGNRQQVYAEELVDELVTAKKDV
jgi:F-type H+-transporting ATPase subunit b